MSRRTHRVVGRRPGQSALWGICVLVSVLAIALAAAPQAAADGEHATSYYLSLGDSLAEGAQPNGDLDHGYADQLYSSLSADEPTLRLVKLGCGGESTVSMRFGSQLPDEVLSCGTPRFYQHRYRRGTQLAHAVSFLEAHKGKVALVTINVGADDLSRFDAQFNVVTGLFEPQGCAAEVARMADNLAVILARLRAAAGPGVPIVGMTYYDVFAPVCNSDPSLMFVCERVDHANAVLADTYAAADLSVADVAGAFENGVYPDSAQHVCDWTWFCSLQDTHLNTEGYGVVAQEFLEALGP